MERLKGVGKDGKCEGGLPLTGVQAYYTPENLAKTPIIS